MGVRAMTEGGTRERILEVALGLFERQGYAGTSLRDISDQLGVTKAALYYHFPSKEALLDAVLAGGTPLPEQVAAAIAGPLPADPGEEAALRVRAACAVACLPAGVRAFRRVNPAASRLDGPTRALLVRTVLAVLRTT